MPASVSSWTRATYEDLDAADEPAEMEDDEEPLMKRRRTRAAGSWRRVLRVVPFSGIGSRAALCGNSRLGLP